MSRRSHPPGITVELQGGLGNQLFIYATGRALASARSCPLYLDDRWFASSGSRTFELDSFRHSGEVLGARARPMGVRSRNALRAAARRLGGWSSSGRLTGTYVERTFGFDARVLELPTGTTLHGYFQSYRYFASVAEALRREIRQLQNPSDWYVQTRHRLLGLGDWHAIHVRRGDYLEPATAAFHGVLDLDYYQRALELLSDNHGRRPVVVFSDDAPAARLFADRLNVDALLVEPPPDSRPLESILLMSGASAVVTANSSFSWWGAWLGEREGRSVVVPRPWFAAGGRSQRDLVPATWLPLDH